MAQKKRISSFFTVLLVILLLIVMVLTLVLGLYKLNRYPVLNNLIDGFISQFIEEQTEPAAEEPVTELIAGIQADAGSILNKTPYFIGEIEKPAHMKPLEHRYTASELTIDVSDDYKMLTVSGMLQRFDPEYDGIDSSVSSWTVHTEYPIISRPCVFQDSIVFIDASPSLFRVNILNGSVSSGQWVPFFPDSQAVSLQASVPFEQKETEIKSTLVSQYAVMGRNGKVYGFAFTGGQVPFMSSFSNRITSSSFTPDKTSLDTMLNVIKNWAGISEVSFVDAPLIMTDDFSPLPITLHDVSFIVFMLPESGNYTAGLSDETGLFIREKAVVCIFTQSGELVGVSVDYEADRPNVTSHFDDNTLYYALTSAQEGKQTESAFFSIKKAVK